MLRIAISDREETGTGSIGSLLDRYREVSGTNMEYDVFPAHKDLLKTVDEAGEYDVYFLEIDAESAAGFETAKLLRARGFIGKIIFVASSADYVFRSFEVQAYRYFLKPVPWEELKSALDELCRSIAQRTAVFIKTQNGDCIIPVRDVLYVEKVGRAACFHLSDGSEITSVSFRGGFHTMIEGIEGLGHSFFPYMKGAVVNLMNVRFFKSSTYEIFLKSGDILFCTRARAAEFRKAFIQYQM